MPRRMPSPSCWRLSPGDPDGAFRDAAALAHGLFPHQIEGVAFLLGRRRAILADDMGLGKTRQAIVALRHAAPDGPYLVVCPASVKRNWAREIDVGGAGGVHPRDRRRRGALPKNSTGSSSTTTSSRSTSTRLRACAGRGCVRRGALPEEPQERAQPAGAAARRSGNGSRRRHPSGVYLLTGTPLTNRPRDLFVLLQLVGHPLGRSFLVVREALLRGGEERLRLGDGRRFEHRRADRAAARRDAAPREGSGAGAAAQAADMAAGRRAEGHGRQRHEKVVELLIGDRELAPGSTVERAPPPRRACWRAVTRARQTLAAAKVAATIDFVTGAVEQGEKVIVFSCFEEPVQSFADAVQRAGGAADRADAGREAPGDRRSVSAGRPHPRVPREHHRRRRRHST